MDSDEFVVFNQPGATSSVLNRVIGSQQSNILGQITANGRVFLVNPQGVYFAPGAKVDVGALTATVLDITNADFMSGNYVSRRSPSAPDGAGIENAGDIKVGDGGYVVLAGDYANNTGVISARLGNVVLAAGSQMTLDLSDDGLVSFAIDEATVSSLAGVNNSGQIVADGGQVIMTAKVANDLVATAVNNDGLLQAHRIVEDGGEIYLSASGGDVVNAGTIDVAGEAGQSGGEVGITGEQDIILTAGSEINANGDGTGNGGVINVIADGTLAFRPDAEITAVAGDSGERGGAVELSGYDGVSLTGELAIGAGGEWMIDPAVATLSSSGYGESLSVGFIQTQLNGGASVGISASSSITKTSSVSAINATGSGGLRFFISDQSGDGDINLAGLEININGDFSATAGVLVGNVNLGKVTSANNVRIFAGSTGGDITLNTGGIAAASSDLTLQASGGNITIGTPALPGNLTLSDASFTDIDIDAGSDVTVFGDISASASGSYGGGAFIDVDAQNLTARDVLAYAGNNVADIEVDVVNDIAVNNVEAEIGTSGSSSGGDARVDLFAGGKITTNGIEAIAGSTSGTAFIRLRADDTVTVNGTVSVSGSSAFFNALASNVNLNGAMNLTATSSAQVFASANNNINVLGNVTINEAGGGSARASYVYGNNGVFCKHTVTAGPGGFAFAGFGSSSAVLANTATFNGVVDVSAAAGGSIGVGVRNSIRTVGAGLLDATSVLLKGE